MGKYLVLNLYGPLAAWGEIAVGQVRHSAAYPSKSAVLGLISAALGIKREEEALHQAMASAYGFGIKVISMGSVLKDYHTSQVPPSQKKAVFHTRRDELKSGKLGTILSSREYRCDALSVAALWQHSDDAPYTLEEIADAIKQPVFALYLGRKSCPPALPLEPDVLTESSLKQALDRPVHPDFLKTFQGGRKKESALYYWDKTDDSGIRETKSIIRHDALLSRKRWQYGTREVMMGFEEEES